MTQPDTILATLVDLARERAAQGGDLDRLAAAVDLAEEIGDLPDRLVGLFVDQARSGGATWSAIGDTLGVSRQAAQQRTVPAAYSRYTNRAMRVVERAQSLAREHGQMALSPGLLMVASCRDPEGLAARILVACGVQPGDLEQALLAELPPALTGVPEHPGFTVAAKQMLDQAVREAQRLGHDYVGTEHLLLATLRQAEGLPGQVVTTFGLSYDAAAARLNGG
jgi:Clp amino terminal domain, pathogenicity island component